MSYLLNRETIMSENDACQVPKCLIEGEYHDEACRDAQVVLVRADRFQGGTDPLRLRFLPWRRLLMLHERERSCGGRVARRAPDHEDEGDRDAAGDDVLRPEDLPHARLDDRGGQRRHGRVGAERLGEVAGDQQRYEGAEAKHERADGCRHVSFARAEPEIRYDADGVQEQRDRHLVDLAADDYRPEGALLAANHAKPSSEYLQHARQNHRPLQRQFCVQNLGGRRHREIPNARRSRTQSYDRGANVVPLGYLRENSRKCDGHQRSVKQAAREESKDQPAVPRHLVDLYGWVVFTLCHVFEPGI